MEGNSIVSNDTLTRIADAIREKTGSTEDITVQEMADMIANFPPDYSKVGEYGIVGSMNNVGTMFRNNGNITHIYLPNVEELQSYAFENCVRLTHVNLPNLVTIKNSTFFNCGVTDINMPNLRYANVCAFQQTNLHNVYLPNLISTGSSMFAGCRNLVSVELPNLYILPTSMFLDNQDLQYVSCPNAYEIGELCFDLCGSLTTVNLDSVEQISGDMSFLGCNSLEELNLPNLVSINGTDVFLGCSNLKTIELPKVTYIMETSMFTDCSSLMTVSLDSYVVPGSDTQTIETNARNLCLTWGITQGTVHFNNIDVTIE